MNTLGSLDIIQLIRDHYGITIVVALSTLGLISHAVEKYRVYAWYAITIAVAWILFAMNGDMLYFYAFLLGMATAFAEIISKFTDEPIKALSAIQALCYHLLNGLMSAFALRVLYLYQQPVTPLDRLKAVVIAGLGAMLLLRSKLFNVKVGGEDVSFGPEQIVKVFFRYMEFAIDRIRAQARIQFVRKKLDNIDFERVCEYTRSMLGAAQALGEKDMEEIGKSFDDIGHSKNSLQLKSYEMGFILLNRMGEDFVSELFDNPPIEWRIKAPEPDQGILSGLLPTKDVLYFAYGSNMCSRRLLERLGWGRSDVQDLKARRAVLPNYTLAFEKTTENPGEGLVNARMEKDSRIEGVLYRLPALALSFIEQNERGYLRREVQVQAEGDKKMVGAQTYFAESVADGLTPTTEYLKTLIDGAVEHSLSDAYISGLKAAEKQPLAKTA